MRTKHTEETKRKISNSLRGRKATPETLAILKKAHYIPPIDSIVNVKTEEAAYLLGFLWADGYLQPRGKDAGMIGLEIIDDDFIDIENILLSVTNSWRIFRDLSKKSTVGTDGVIRKPQAKSYLNSTTTYKYLKEMNYKDKKILSCNKILNTIPTELQHYWWRGFFDGDGCIYVNYKNKCYQATICGDYNQDWSCYDKLLNDLEIKHSLRRIIGKKSNYSQMRITNKSDCLKLMNYLYKGKVLGLKRKYDKFKILYDYSINQSSVLNNNST